jgi:hypothetical protein
MNFAQLLIAVLFFFLTVHVSSQEKDAGWWSSVTMEKKISQMISASISEEFRFNENVSELGVFFTDAGMSFRLGGVFRISANYRFINKRRMDDSYSKRHRYYLDLSYREKFGKLTPVLRVRFQSQYADVYSSPEGWIPSYYLRPKISFRYNRKGKWSPYISSELFFSISGKEFDNVRYTAGMERNINKKISFDIFFIHQREFNVERPVYDYIWGTGINYSL